MRWEPPPRDVNNRPLRIVKTHCKHLLNLVLCQQYIFFEKFLQCYYVRYPGLTKVEVVRYNQVQFNFAGGSYSINEFEYSSWQSELESLLRNR